MQRARLSRNAPPQVGLIGLVTLALALAPRAAGAGEQHAPNVAAQLSRGGLAFVAAEAKKRVPRSLSHPTYRRTLVDCPFTSNDTVLTLSGTKTMLLVRDLLVFTDGARVNVLAKLDVSGFSYLKITRPYACVGYPLQCRMDYIADKLIATASFRPRLSGGKLQLVSPRVQVSVSPSTLEAGVVGCGLVGDLVNLALPPAKAFLQGELQRRIGEAIERQVAPQVSTMLGDLGAGRSVQSSGYRLDASLVQLSSSTSGLQVGGRVDVQATTKGSCVAEDAPPISASPSPRIGAHDEDLGVALSGSVIARAVQAAWRSGLFCLSNQQLAEQGITHQLPGLATYMLGLTGSAPLSVAAPRAPELRLLPSEQGAKLRMTLPGLELRIAGQGPQGATNVTARGDALVDLELGVDAQTRSVVVASASGELSELRLSADKPEGLRLEQKMLLKLIEGLISSLVQSKLKGLTVSPQVLQSNGTAFDDYLLDLRRARTTHDHLYLYLDLFARPAWDRGRPDTGFLRRPPARTSQQVFVLEAHGRDDKTPASLLRYRFRVDGGAWTPTAYGDSHAVELAEGDHRIEVVAVDQNGNADATPALVELTVDASAPAGRWGKGDDPGTLAPERDDAAGGCTAAPGALDASHGFLTLMALLALAWRRRPYNPGTEGV